MSSASPVICRRDQDRSTAIRSVVVTVLVAALLFGSAVPAAAGTCSAPAARALGRSLTAGVTLEAIGFDIVMSLDLDVAHSGSSQFGM
ncbi:hypothetical protein OHB00_40480 [Streptomyces sp. NBC_00631]|uniref:hypothetical protein n=1 Tax=Streptomyces sp. NBC_00631 TaxID=2975793 RepID=UPI0030E17AB3